MVNDDIDRLRHAATYALLERRDTVVCPPAAPALCVMKDTELENPQI